MLLKARQFEPQSFGEQSIRTFMRVEYSEKR